MMAQGISSKWLVRDQVIAAVCPAQVSQGMEISIIRSYWFPLQWLSGKDPEHYGVSSLP
jgi:hypothetical protein